MKTKIIQFIPISITIAIIGFRYFSLWCIDSVSVCYGSWIHQSYQYFTSPAYDFSIFVFITVSILLFVPAQIFNSWLKFAAWAIPLSIFYIATTPVVDTSFLPFHRDDAARLAAKVFSTASLVVLVFSFARVQLYESDERKHGVEYADANIKDLPLVFAAGIGFISAIVASWTLFSNSFDFFELFIITGFVSVLSNIYALGYAILLSYQKVHAGAPFGSKLTVSIALLCMTLLIGIVTWVIIPV